MEAHGLLAEIGLPFPKVDQGTMHLMVGSSAGVEVVTGKVHRKIFRQWQGVLTAVEGFEAFCIESGIVEKGPRH